MQKKVKKQFTVKNSLLWNEFRSKIIAQGKTLSEWLEEKMREETYPPLNE